MTIGLLLTTCGLMPGQDAPSWAPTSPLAQARHSGCAARLGDGRVLITGGIGSDSPLASAELYLSDGTFVPASAMIAARSRHGCVQLADGRVFVAGGDPNGGTAEIYDPQGNAWQAIDGTRQARFGAAITLLRDHRVIIAGGSSADGTPLASVEIFNPEDNTLSPITAALSAPRDRFTAILQSDGSVLFTGGINGDGPLNSTDRFRPADNSIIPGPALNIARYGHSATLLLNGRTFVAGGSDGAQDLDSAELLDPAAGVFQLVAAKLQVARRDHFATLVPGNGGVLLAGGSQGDQALAATELFQPVDAIFVRLGDLTAPRTSLIAAPVADGLILAAGGLNADGPQTACGLFLLPSIQVTKSIYRPLDQVQVSGSNFRPNTRVNFTLELLSGATVALSNSRLITSSATTPQGALFQLQTGFGAVPILNTQGGDAGKIVLIIGQAADGTTVQASAPIRIATSLTVNQPTGLYEGLSATFLAQLNRTAGPIAMTGLLSLSASPSVAGCISDGTSNTLVIAEGQTANSVSSNLNVTSGTAFLSKTVTNVPTTLIKLVATYTGDSAHDSAGSSACFAAVSRTPSLQLSAPTSAFSAGTPFSLTAVVKAQPGSPQPTPGGTVNFFLDNFSLGAAQNSGATNTPPVLTASRQFTPLTTGPFSFTAQYIGDPFFKSVTSSAFSINAQKAATAISLVNVPTTFHCDAPFTAGVHLTFPPSLGLVNKSVSLQAQMSDGSVRFVAGSSTVLSVFGPGFASGSFSLPSLSADTLRLQAAFDGDSLLQGAVSGPMSPVLITSQVLVEIRTSPVPQTNPVTFTVRLTPQGCSGLPTGNIEILDNGSPVTIVPVSQLVLSGTSAVDTAVTIARSSGAHSIQARYSGDRAYQPRTSAAAIISFQ